MKVLLLHLNQDGTKEVASFYCHSFSVIAGKETTFLFEHVFSADEGIKSLFSNKGLKDAYLGEWNKQTEVKQFDILQVTPERDYTLSVSIIGC